MSNKTLGVYGESLARQYLLDQGYRILEENFRSKLGEIDLIAKDGKTICFIEVKTRQSLDQGQPYEAVTSWKIRKLSQLAALYLKYKYGSLEIPSRFDVVSIIRDKTGLAQIQHLKNAFEAIL
ncbi:MAG: YraN family protein [Candidatus Omnitrophica bacterium]|nr:YraN family protein [Candidatus Omnitrophota bacterium]MDE2008773.1 YraN family protein [Candidatus Omnitrophota bacterium]MDE2213664.1 YraN family protein [Candidatus Omnitrophota bacterium]MDE2230435.1 YraN family protein [Candidatus Omnitrophota bacterium]